VKKPYQIVTRAAKESAAVVEQFCQANGQILLPIVHLMESASEVVESVLHEIQAHVLETIFVHSAEQVAGARTPGRPSGEIRWHGSQPGKIKLADRALKLQRPRLRHRREGEVKIPAYEQLRRDRGLRQQMLGALLRGVSTREYDEILPKMAETVGVARSSVSRQAIEASAEKLKSLRERRWDSIEILVIGIDGQRFGEHHILSAVGVDRQGRKHILGIEAGATENAGAGKRLLTHLRDQGLATDRKYLCHRRRESLARRHRRSVRRRPTRAAVQESQVAQRSRRVAGTTARPGVEPDAGGLESDDGRRRRKTLGTISPLSGAGP
jgi:hypothetical protein